MDLRTGEGRRHIRKLISMSDVVAENFSVGVTRRLGVDYEDCRSIAPGIVYVSLPAFGRTGPESGFVGMGATQEAMSGLLGISSYPGAPPVPTGVKYGDPNGGLLAARRFGLEGVAKAPRLGILSRESTRRGMR